jgi:hypothetical protein
VLDYAQQAAAALRDLDRPVSEGEDDGDTFNLAWSSAADDLASPIKRATQMRHAQRRQRGSGLAAFSCPISSVVLKLPATDMHEVTVGGDKMRLQFRDGRVTLMNGTHRHLLDYLTSTQVRGVLYQVSYLSLCCHSCSPCELQSKDRASEAGSTGQSTGWHGRRVGVQDMLTETADAQFEAIFLLCFRYARAGVYI